MATNKVSKATIDTIPIDELGGIAHDVMQSIFILNTTTFTGTKPTTETAMELIVSTFIDKRGNYKQGGLGAKKPYETAHNIILGCLYSFIPYVNGLALGDETILKLSRLPYSDGSNTSSARIKKGEIAKDLAYVPENSGSAKISCAYFGKNVQYITIIVKGSKLPDGVFMNSDGQLIFPEGATTPLHVININGKRDKKVTNLEAKTDYYLYYVLIANGVVSALSIPIIIGCLN